MNKLTNKNNIPLNLAVWLAHDTYDYDAKTISATALLKPVRQIILAARARKAGLVDNDVSDFIASSLGTAIHDSIERAWLEGAHRSLERLGYEPDYIKRFVINPPVSQKLPDEAIPVYMEQRLYKEFMGYKISGKFDLIMFSQLHDYKSTSVYSFMLGSKDNDYRTQGGIYRWLGPELITDPTMVIDFIFTDWSAARAKAEAAKGYPQQRVMAYELPLPSIEETENFVKNKLNQIEQYQDADESDIPWCTDEELWASAAVWKYYKNPQNTARATKNYDNPAEAYAHRAKDNNVGIVVEVPGQVKACNYCAAFPVCKQKDALIEQGRLVIE